MKNRETWLAKERRQNPFAKLMDVENIIVIAENYICVVTDAAPTGIAKKRKLRRRYNGLFISIGGVAKVLATGELCR